MHRHLMFAATLCLSAGSAFAAFPTLDVANATVDLAVSQAELDAANGPAGISIRGMGILPSGNLIIWDNDNAAGAGLLEIDVSGVSPVITTLVDHADVVAVTTDPSVSPNAIRATSRREEMAGCGRRDFPGLGALRDLSANLLRDPAAAGGFL